MASSGALMMVTLEVLNQSLFILQINSLHNGAAIGAKASETGALPVMPKEGRLH
jgi:hypothetical protein